MTTRWIGDAELVRAVERTLGSKSPAAAVAVVSREREMTALLGVDGNSDFEIGSISKALTGMMYCDAKDRGLISSTTVLGDVLPLDDHGEIGSVTLTSLSTHRSGLPRLPPGMHPLRRTLRLWAYGANPYGESLADLLAQIRDLRVGTPRPLYSNLGFQLLGHSVAAAADTTYTNLLQETLGPGFWAPVHKEELGPTSVTGVSRTGRPRAAWVGEAVAPAGGIRASISTMRYFLRSVLEGTARGLSALDPVVEFSRGVRIGAGWITLEHGGRTITWHNGGTGGFRSWIGLDRTADAAVVVLSASNRPVDRHGFRLLTRFGSPEQMKSSLPSE